jgi:NADPH:quinone reductase
MSAVPISMRQVRFAGAGGPDVIRIESAPVPRPGAGQVLVEVVAAGVNRPDCQQRVGSYPPPPDATEVPGLEIAGRVVAVGPDVSWPRTGYTICALVISGGYADYCIAEAALCLPVPKALSLIEAAGVPETYFTVYDNVLTRGRLKPGERFLVHGGSSAIGSTAIQIAKHTGAIVYATAGSPEKCRFCISLGADAAIEYRAQDFVEEVNRLTGGDGVDVILDMVGGGYIQKNVSLLAVEGRLVQISFLQTGIVGFDFRAVMSKRLTITGSRLRPRSVELKSAIAEGLRRDIWPLLDSGAVRPFIYATFPLEQAGRAHELMESSAHMGKIMLVTGL